MAEKIAQDPSFAQMAQAMQANMGAMMGGAGGPPPAPTGRGASGASADESGLPGGMPGMPGMDPSAYANMMSGVLQNPQFVEMAEKLGQQIMQVSALYVSCTCCLISIQLKSMHVTYAALASVPLPQLQLDMGIMHACHLTCTHPSDNGILPQH